MDSKKVIEALVKIAHNQQKIIQKLAQQGTRDVEVNVPDQSGMAPTSAPPVKLPMPMPTHLSAEDDVKKHMGPFAAKVSKLYFTTNNLPKGASFKVQYAPAGQAASDPHLAKTVENAVVAAQKAGNPSVPAGNFVVEPWRSAGLKL